MEAMLCPLCRSELVKGAPCRYQTLDEHICRPNSPSPLRSTLVCSNANCGTHEGETFWAFDGEGPYGGTRKEPKWIDGNPIPFGSYHRKIYFSCCYHAEDRRFTVGKLTVRREVTYESDDYGNKVGKRVRYSIWWNNILYHSGVRMLIFSLKRFYKRKSWSEAQAIDAVRGISQRAEWPRAEWWRKVARFWVRLFHPTLYRKALSE